MERASEGKVEYLELEPYLGILDAQGIMSNELAELFPYGPEELGDMNGKIEPSEDAAFSPAPSSGVTPSNGFTRSSIFSPELPLQSPSKGKAPSDSIFPISSGSTPYAIQEALHVNPEETARAITRLPLDLTSLDLFTILLDMRAFEPEGIDPSHITREYIQHCLRIIERLGSAFSPSSDHSSTSPNPLAFPEGYEDPNGATPGGREEQARAVKLLVLFMKNLFMKGLLPVQELLFEIEEVCVRFIWIPEVRDFRRFLEGGAIGDEAGANKRAGG